MSETLLLEISTALGDIVAQLEKPDEAVPKMLLEVSTALGDLVRATEERKALDLTALVAAVRALELQAPAVTVQSHNHMPPVQVVVQQNDIRVTKIKFKADHFGQFETAELVYGQITKP